MTTLIMLVMMTVIAVTAARMGALEERMAGSTRDRDLALRAAEMALRDAERDISNAVSGSARGISGCSRFVRDCGARTATARDDGLCWGAAGDPIWKRYSMTAAPSVPYGSFTGATAISGLSAAPRYLIECMRKRSDNDYFYFYRITARAQGAKPGTVVMLEEMFKLAD